MSSEQKQEQPEASQANMAPSSTEPSQETHTTATEVQKHDLGEVHTTTSEIKKIDLGEIQTTTETFTTYIEPESKSLVWLTSPSSPFRVL